jgi:hypothetical protein
MAQYKVHANLKHDGNRYRAGELVDESAFTQAQLDHLTGAGVLSVVEEAKPEAKKADKPAAKPEAKANDGAKKE